MPDDRDRRDDGRPEQTRPRDRTGRPLPYGTTGVLLTEEHDPATVEEALLLGVALWNDGRLFEAHECLEHVWHAAPDADRDLWQGVIQVAVAGVHLQRGNVEGAITTFDKAHRRLSRYPDVHRGIDVEQLAVFCTGARAALRDAGAVIEVGFPELPVMDDGPWFASDPAALGPSSTPTVLDRTPAWQRRPRRRPTRPSAPEPPGGSS